MAYNIGLKGSFWSEAEEIWEICEPSKFPFIPCYTRVRSDSDESAASPRISVRNPQRMTQAVYFYLRFMRKNHKIINKMITTAEIPMIGIKFDFGC